MGKLKFIELELAGSFVIEPSAHADERGFFQRFYCENEFSEFGIARKFVQFNQSFNKLKGLIRGLHFQTQSHAEAKLIKCSKGAAYDVIVDLRANSSSYLKWHGEIISAENMKMVYVPEGFAHGFQTLTDETEIYYFHTGFYSPDHQGGVNALDSQLSIKWPLEVSMMSVRDKALPLVHSIKEQVK